MKYTRWAFKNKKTKSLGTAKAVNGFYNDELQAQEIAYCSTRDEARNWKRFSCLKNFTIAKVVITIKEAA